MDPSTYTRRPGAFSPRPPSSPGLAQSRPESAQSSQSIETSESNSSSSSQVTERSRATQNSPFPPQTAFQRPSIVQQPPSSNASSTSISNFSRPAPPNSASDRELPSRRNSPLIGADGKSHRRQHSQGFFEPTLPSLPSSSSAEQQAAMAGKLNASQIAAQAAMQHQSSAAQHMRKRSQTVPSPQTPPDPPGSKRKPAPIQTGSEPRRPSGGQPYSNGSVGLGNAAAATAANVAYPKSAPLSPGLTSFDLPQEKEHRLHNQRSKMKLFSNRPKQTSINSALESKDRPIPSPNKIGQTGQSSLGKLANASVTSFADSIASGASSIYTSNNHNASTSTLIPADRPGTANEKEKERKHHFLSRQKNKLKDKLDEHSLPLSSSSSNSRPLDPAAPQPLYSFAAPASPGPSTTSFAKSVSGLDLRHGGRALREKKKEEKAMPTLADLKRAEVERLDWAGTGPSGPVFGTSAPFSHHGSYGADIHGQSTLQGFGLNNMSAEDAWDFLRAKLLIIFTEGGELRMPVEDLNKLVLVNIQRCVARRSPNIIIEDFRDLLQTGFASLDHSLRIVPEHRIVPHLVDMWLLVFGTILPYVQAVFLPLDLEFKGHGSIMLPREAAEFWGADPDSTNAAFGSEFDVRRIVLLSYRDHVILPRHDTLKAIFSRLSLESINPSVSLVNEYPDPGRPSTAASLDPGLSSFNSQGSTLIGDGNRSRATSNLSAPELPPFASPPSSRRHPPSQQEQHDTSSTQVTETVGRMLQCVSVLASLQSTDESQIKMEALAKELKLNWLGRGRTGRNRRGFVGTRVRNDANQREGNSRREVSAR